MQSHRRWMMYMAPCIKSVMANLLESWEWWPSINQNCTVYSKNRKQEDVRDIALLQTFLKTGYTVCREVHTCAIVTQSFDTLCEIDLTLSLVQADLHVLGLERIIGHTLTKRDMKDSSVKDNALKALIMLHSCGILHRDLRPPNILVKPDKSVVLIDFDHSSKSSSSSLHQQEQKAMSQLFKIA